jgi:hypothetical protein
MDTNKLNEKALRKFLLGNMSQKKQEAAELWLMCNEEACSQLEAAEDDLIDDFLAGKLTARDRQQFMTHFIASPERERKLQFGSALKRHMERVAPKKEAAATPIWEKTAAFFTNRMASAYAAAAMFLIFLIGAPVSYIKIVGLEQELDSTNVQLAYLQDSESGFQLLTQAVTDFTSGPGIRLNEGLTRNSNNIPDAQVSPTAFTKFSLTLTVDYDEYSVVLCNAEGKELWPRVEGLKATKTPEGASVDLAIPSEIFKAGRYYFSLAGISDSQPPEYINDYHFHAVIS